MEAPIPAELSVQAAPLPAAPLPVSPAQVAYQPPSPAEVAWRELHLIQDEEEQLWSRRRDYHIALPVTGIVFGIPMFMTMVPMGAVLVADSKNYSSSCFSSGNGQLTCDDDTSYSHQERRIGRTLLAFGTIGALILAAGSYGLAKARRRRHADETKLESLASRRSLLERLLEAQFKSVVPY
ncbi:MAG: hypothetical protein JWN48_4918 [Myxococcaceae bacterium]|nr:hypothetical protein [Myxococcaceae bacterium]